MIEEKDVIYIYADGGVRNNQSRINIGAWGAVLRFNGAEKIFYGHEYSSTNNRMELLSAINGLKKINNVSYPIIVVMDSQYVVKGITQWIYKWIDNNWKTANGDAVKNVMLWKRLLHEKNRLREVTFEKCSGHSDNDGNNKADKICNMVMDNITKGDFREIKL